MQKVVVMVERVRCGLTNGGALQDAEQLNLQLDALINAQHKQMGKSSADDIPQWLDPNWENPQRLDPSWDNPQLISRRSCAVSESRMNKG